MTVIISPFCFLTCLSTLKLSSRHFASFTVYDCTIHPTISSLLIYTKRTKSKCRHLCNCVV
ncbi:hypothetical protein M378DRAFT_159235 [Amanita muscaria Koide BX008]|uniref:Uncharacterized protein n=1 Tax=Amanita muscaria (strain Koide BX008) TaxID=946122 RepID=A0A0C2XEZ0_AMAMK|nr:hypothetical protein M378DRAFT_159235 [Amanita muscaria Koide BX008]